MKRYFNPWIDFQEDIIAIELSNSWIDFQENIIEIELSNSPFFSIYYDNLSYKVYEKRNFLDTESFLISKNKILIAYKNDSTSIIHIYPKYKIKVSEDFKSFTLYDNEWNFMENLDTIYEFASNKINFEKELEKNSIDNKDTIVLLLITLILLTFAVFSGSKVLTLFSLIFSIVTLLIVLGSFIYSYINIKKIIKKYKL